MNSRTLKRAIGVSSGKTLTLANECASIEIQQVQDHASRAWTYIVSGDARGEFSDLRKALAFAVAELALYMDGSLNR